MKWKIRAPMLSLLVLLAGPALAQNPMSGVRAMGMGEAYTANATGTGALFHNPAGISSLLMYSIETSYLYDQTTGMSVLHASIVDGKSNESLGGGLGYSYSVSSSEAELPGFSGHDVYGALAAPIVPGWIITGASIHYLEYSQFDEVFSDGVTVDIGLLFTLGDYFALGAAAHNLIEVEQSGRNLETSFGVAFRTNTFLVSGDTVLDFAEEALQTDYHAGIEYLAVGRVPVRLGYQYLDSDSDQVVTAGVGWRHEVLGLDALLRQSVQESGNRMIGLAIDLYL